ncbi:glyceraldehyde-3-phosphate dehydrogenase [Candidatus Methanoliparum sp. LAM-1]|nr:type II glyceraldehyde-3-phosphate dehydrogenase [Candidatus Methanoliparum sp. LAM-1]BDC35889.1 glyceraldehyde-3-phosphate dehydrogenase [Candidatus Methanoliparum sp. LAM-1]
MIIFIRGERSVKNDFKMIKVGINGYGTIGKRVADAVSCQEDMRVVGVVKTKPDFISKMAVKIYKLYTTYPENIKEFKNKGIEVEGTIDNLLDDVDVVVDASPEGIGAKNKIMYERHGVKAIFQGGETHELTGVSFNAQSNYKDALYKDYVRVVSCNTTGLCRTLKVIDELAGIKKVNATIIRRATDPGDSKKGPINAIEPVLKIPSHHGPDVKTVLPRIDISTMAVKVPTTLMHLHAITVDLIDKKTSLDDIINAFNEARRVILINGADRLASTAEIMEYARDLGRKRGDLFEIAVWRDGTNIKDGVLYYYQAIHQESDVVPENIDAIRAVMGMEDGEKSMDITDKNLGIIRSDITFN